MVCLFLFFFSFVTPCGGCGHFVQISVVGMQVFSFGVMESCFQAGSFFFVSEVLRVVVCWFKPGLVCKFCVGASFGTSCSFYEDDGL